MPCRLESDLINERHRLGVSGIDAHRKGIAGESAVIANVAGIEVVKRGAATVTPDELLAYVDAHALHA